MGDIIDFPEGTKGDIAVADVLDAGKFLDMVVVMGYTPDGQEYFASSSGCLKENNWLADRFKDLLREMASNGE
jgi:hypothetical protein